MDDVRRFGGRVAAVRLAREIAAACEGEGLAQSGRREPVLRANGHLARVVEAEIIPRLMLAHAPRLSSGRGHARPGRKPSEAEIATFSDLILAPPCVEVEARIESLIADGLSLESLLLDLLAPTARHLGALWEEDVCDFADLTVAMGRLQRIMHDLSLRYAEESFDPLRGRSILLSPCPGETHIFGLSMLERFFRDAGWDVVGTALDAAENPLARASTEWFDVIGLSLHCEVHLPKLTEAVREIRRRSHNCDVRILVGGSIFVDNPGLASLVDADATAVDARAAVLVAESLLDLQARAC
ncbi:cobalamin B12-binding domain-containing protein [Methylobacterium durans]|uniref:cobalamin B12-binding domain-containing protein n=1 Tax=Methylobacterium durans TaxID=2202825 RepID=UPI002AFFF88C|nr:cobalamin B12-binding domain-containing protein [Methylobacterium durans]MEA1830693.1 cobalamin B12-binding domain-containing protein [Methylobacterium durans]